LETSTNGNGASPQKIKIEHPSDNIKQYISIIRANIFPIILIFISAVIATVLYVTAARDIFKSTTTLKISKPQGSILTGSVLPEFQDFQNDRFVSNEIEVLKSFRIREMVAKSIIDSIKNHNNDEDLFITIIRKEDGTLHQYIPVTSLAKSLAGIVTINQKRGLDIVEISAESPSRYEAQLIANVYAATYVDFSISFSRRELIIRRKFLDEEKEKKQRDLANSEAALQDYMQRGGLLFLDNQAQKLVDLLSDFESQKNFAEVEVQSSKKAYDEIKKEIERVDKSVLDYVEGQISEPYLKELQTKSAEIEIQRDIELSLQSDERLKGRIKNEYDKKLESLKSKLEQETGKYRTGIMASTPAEKLGLSQKYFDVNLTLSQNKARVSAIKKLLSKYDAEFAKLPEQSIELARLQRDKLGNEKLYLTLEEKFQEAILNERVQLGNVTIVDEAMLPTSPAKPNRQLILIAGIVLGLALGVGFAFLRNYLDRSIKSPEELENKGVPILAWVPSIEELREIGSSQLEFIVANKPNATASESFKAMRTRVQYSKLEEDPLKTILVTSSIPSEGKTTVALNLAGSFAQADKKVLLLDCDLRKPRVHAIFETQRFPGLSDHLFGNVSYEDIVRQSRLENLKYITSGTIPPNPSEMLGSKQLKEFILKVREKYDYVIIDSPPYISVTDSEILARIADGTIIVVQANKTPMDVFLKTFDRVINLGNHKSLGAVLNNFNFRSMYGYYYNYYYYYSKPEGKKKKEFREKGKISPQ
jgi:tyrosine-protein kinase Etk/Wzc